MKKTILPALALLLSPLFLVAACDGDGSQEPAPQAPAPTTATTATSPTTTTDPTEVPDAGRRDLSDGGFHAGKSDKPM